eukprot:g2007.t1
METTSTTPTLDLKGDRWNLILLLFLYTLQGIPMGLAGSIPFFLQESGASMASQSLFSLVSWPFSLKILWAPIVDATFIKNVGRRKTWLLPVQFVAGVMMIAGSDWLLPLLRGETSLFGRRGEPDVLALTVYFFVLFFLMATQDISVDGWALTMLSKRNVGLASTCNSVGQTIGYFVAYTGFLSLYAAGLVTLSGFVFFWGVVFIAATVILSLKRERDDSDVAEDVFQAYRTARSILQLRPVQTYVGLLLTARILTATETIAPLKLMESGLPKEHLAMLSAFMTPVSIVMPGLVSKWIAGPRPLDIYMRAYGWRVACVVAGACVVCVAHFSMTTKESNDDDESKGLPYWVYAIIVALSLVHTTVSSVMFTAQMAFHNGIARNLTRLGGTYMTLLNTFANLGGMWPTTFAMSVSDSLSVEAFSIDGYYVVTAACACVGSAWLAYAGPLLLNLQDLPSEKWGGDTYPAGQEGSIEMKRSLPRDADDSIRAQKRNAIEEIEAPDARMELSGQSVEAQRRHAKILQELEVKRRANYVKVPTLEKDVKARLREIGRPITLFGERPEDRLKRLRLIVAAMEVQSEESGAVGDLVSSILKSRKDAADRGSESSNASSNEKQRKKFYTPASAELKTARKAIALFSFERARTRLARTRKERADLSIFRKHQENAVDLYSTLSHLMMNGSQIGDERPLSGCALSKDGESRYLVTTSWNGVARLWDRSLLNRTEEHKSSDDAEMLQLSFRGHEGRVQYAEFRPSGVVTNTSSASVVTASSDGTAKLWSLRDAEAIATLDGHRARLARAKWHPMGKHVGTTSFDTTLRLWDAETSKELLLQEGHTKETYGIAFHPDGGLVASGDLGGVGHVWDLRSGKSVFVMRKHVKGIVSMDWSPDGRTLATGSQDHTVRLWDIRKCKCAYVLPAHSALVSTVKFAPTSGEFLMTTSFDRTCKLWNTRNWSMISELRGHDGYVTGADISQNERNFVTASYDRTWKHWAHESEF